MSLPSFYNEVHIIALSHYMEVYMKFNVGSHAGCFLDVSETESSLLTCHTGQLLYLHRLIAHSTDNLGPNFTFTSNAHSTDNLAPNLTFSSNASFMK